MNEKYISLNELLFLNDNKVILIRDGVERYSLHIAEEDGQVDWDFQVLPPNDTINKFGFKILALVEKKDFVESNEGFVVTV